VLARDNHCCVVTGFVDHDYAVEMKRRGMEVANGRRVQPTTAAHIIPFSLAPNSEKAVAVRDLEWIP
jgi:hypothetical protein